jgi:membrane protease YdiL (CAAX protease family)
LAAYLLLVILISGGFVAGIKLLGKSGNYLAGFYMLGPAIAAVVARLFFYRGKFTDARLGFGGLKSYLKFWGITLGIVCLSFLMYTLLGSVSWDLSGDTFLAQFTDQMAASGKNINDLPAGLSPKTMLLIFFLGGLSVFNIPTIVFGFGEEFGWRGFMFPRLCRRGLRFAFVVGGLIWFAWHVPLMLVMPGIGDLTVAQHAFNIVLLAIGSVCSFVFFAYVYAKSGTIWVAAFAHAVMNNASRSFSYFVKIEDQVLANLGLAVTMAMVVGILYVAKQFTVFDSFLMDERDACGSPSRTPD